MNSNSSDPMNYCSLAKKKKKGIITVNPPVVRAKITLPTRGLKSVT